MHAGRRVVVTDACFDAKTSRFSLGDELLSTVGVHPDVPPQGTIAYSEVGMRADAMLQLVDNLGSLSLVWLSLLVASGILLWHKDGGPVPQQLRYVVGTSSVGALVAHVQPFKAAGRNWVCVRPQGRLRVSQQLLRNLGG